MSTVSVRSNFTVSRGAVALAFLVLALTARAGEVQVAVAANFAAPMQKIAAGFAQDTGHKAVVIIGATGQLYAQIKNGAPFEVLLAADAQTPKRLEDEGQTVPGQRFTYAIGKLVLFSAMPGFVDSNGAVLNKGAFQHVALANTKTAPYGAAGQEALKALGLWEAIEPKIVQGESIAQAFQFVISGNAELGFVAMSQVAPPDQTVPGSWWEVPQKLYGPIRQDAVLLKKGEGQPAAVALMNYLRSDKAKALIRAYGYAY
jgi:molybdate transport system substrate-binding protein